MKRKTMKVAAGYTDPARRPALMRALRGGRENKRHRAVWLYIDSNYDTAPQEKRDAANNLLCFIDGLLRMAERDQWADDWECFLGELLAEYAAELRKERKGD